MMETEISNSKMERIKSIAKDLREHVISHYLAFGKLLELIEEGNETACWQLLNMFQSFLNWRGLSSTYSFPKEIEENAQHIAIQFIEGGVPRPYVIYKTRQPFGFHGFSSYELDGICKREFYFKSKTYGELIAYY